MPAIVPAAGGELGVLPRRLRAEMPHKFPLFFHQRLLTKKSRGWLGKRKRINFIFSADRSCFGALNGFQDSGVLKYGFQFTGLINNICPPARQGRGRICVSGRWAVTGNTFSRPCLLKHVFSLTSSPLIDVSLWSKLAPALSSPRWGCTGHGPRLSPLRPT